jgi:hypothetical protein
MRDRRHGSERSGGGPVIEYVIPFIESILEGDRQAPRKQRHTAHRIWQRLQIAMPELRVAESTIRRYVGQRKRELGWSARRVDSGSNSASVAVHSSGRI